MALLSSLLLGLFIVISTLFIMTRNKQVRIKICFCLFAISFFGGFFIYTHYYLYVGNNFSDSLYAALRGMLSTGRMFFEVSDDHSTISAFKEQNSSWLFGNIWGEIIFWICHVLALIVFQAALFSIFGNKLINALRIWLNAKMPLKSNEYHYIIIGCNKSTNTFLTDLMKTVKKNKITIITGEQNDESNEYLKYYNLYVEEGFAIINGVADKVILEKVGISNLRRKTRVIAMTESDQQNLAVADVITRKIFLGIFPDKNYEKKFLKETIDSLSFIPKSEQEILNDARVKMKLHIENALREINLEAYVMYSFIERTEHFTFAENAYGKVDFFNPYELRVRDFYWNHPITESISHLIDTERARLKGIFKSNGKIYKDNDNEYSIRNIFIGFGSSNFQMLKGSVLTGQLLGCDYNATIYDKAIFSDKPSVHQAMFMNYSSGIFPGGDETLKDEEYYNSPSEKYNIIFKNGNVLTKDFYNDLFNDVSKTDLSLIYISLGDDKLSIETACEIRQHLYEHGINSNKQIRIFVKISEESVFNSDLVINNPHNIPLDIQCFGYNSVIFTKENIISEKLDLFTQAITNKNHGTLWKFLSETERDINRQVTMAIKVKLNLLGFDIADKNNLTDYVPISDEEYGVRYVGSCNDKIKNIYLLSKRIAEINNEIGMKKNSEDDIKTLQARLKELKDERSTYILDYTQTDDGQVGGAISDCSRNNLAQLEHLRWNTFHLIHGWTKKPKATIGMNGLGRKDKFMKQHACITTFKELIVLREYQARKICENDSTVQLEKAMAKADTIWYDFNLMDELIVRLIVSDKIITKSEP